MNNVAGEDMRTVEEFSAFPCDSGRLNTKNGIHCLCRSDMVRARTDPANPRGYARYLLYWLPLAELLESPKLHYLKEHIGNVSFLVEEDLYLGFPFQSGYGFYGNPFIF